MAGLSDMLENYRNWRGRQEWESGKGWQDFYNGDPVAQERFEKWSSGFGTGSHGLGGMMAGTITPAIGVSKIPKIENLAKAAKKFIYHSGTADMAPDLRYGITPTNEGEWVREVAQGATDDVDELLERTTPLSWYSDAPEWIRIKVARKLGKPLQDITEQDVIEHGHLAMVPKKGAHAEDVWYVGNNGLDEDVTNLLGQKRRPTLTDLYDENSYGLRTEPFGVERNEYVTAKELEPMFQLTGNDLLSFLKAIGSKGGK